MAKFKENELIEILKDFNNVNIVIEFERALSGLFNFENVNIWYEPEDGYIYIKNKDIMLKINSTMVFGYEKNNNKIKIDLDSIMLKISK